MSFLSSRPTLHAPSRLGHLGAAAYLACLLVTPCADAHAADRPGAVPAPDYGNLPLSFEANQGQTGQPVRFLSRGSGYLLYLTVNEAVLALQKPSAGQSGKTHPLSQSNPQSSILRMQIKGANGSPGIAGEEKLAGTANYFIGNDSKKWHTGLPTYGKVRYAGIYPGVDLVYYGNQRQLEYDFVVAPGASANPIQLHFDGAKRLRLEDNGDLAVVAGAGEIVFHKPVLYQDNDGGRQPIEGRFALEPGNSIGFATGAYDRTRPLVIDPTLVYSTYLGGTTEDDATAIAVDAAGNAYVTGLTYSSDFPDTSSGYQHTNDKASTALTAFVAKLNPAGTALVYATYLGGSTADAGNAIAVDANGNAYVAGETESSDFPVTTGAFQTSDPNGGGDYTAFVTKLNPTGTALLYSTYLGGTDSYSESPTGEDAIGIAVDGSGDAFVVGYTASSDFPVTQGAYQTSITNFSGAGFVAKLNPAGSGLIYSTLLGGSNNGSNANTVAIDSAGDAFVGGSTYSANFPVTSGTVKTTFTGSGAAFVTKLNPTGTGILYSTFLAGSSQSTGQSDTVYTIALDASNDAFVAGVTSSTNFPVTSGAFQRTNPNTQNSVADTGFVAKLNPAGTSLSYATYLGGNYTTVVYGMKVDSSGNAYVAGNTASTNFPITSDALQSTNPTTSTFGSGFLTELNPQGTALVHSTYLGGTNGAAVNGLSLDNSGDVYLAGDTNSENFPVTTGAFQTTNKDSMYGSPAAAAFITKVALGAATTKVGTSSELQGTPNPQVVNKIVTFTATVSPDSGSATPTGNITSTIDGATGPTITLSGGEATFTTDSLTVGSHTIIATYSGDTNFAPSTSNTLTETITAAQTNPTLSPASLTFPATAVGSTSATQTVTFSNPGSTAVTVSSFAFTGANAAEFLISGKNCGSSLAAGASCTLALAFKPTATGSATATFNAKDNASNSPQTVALSGSTPSGAPTAALTPATLTFPATAVGSTSATQTVTFKNTGTAAITVSSFTFTGANGTQFLISGKNCGSTLAAGASCTLLIAFKPTAAGSATATFNAADNATGSPQTVALSGSTPSGAPTATLTPATLTFPATAIGSTSATQSVTFKNTGSSVLTVSSFTFTGTNAAEFLLSGKNCGSTLAAGASCTLLIAFKPTAAGSAAAAFNAKDNASSSPQTVALSGSTPSGAPTATLTPSTLTFPSTAVGATSASQTVTFKNTGTAAMTVSSFTFTGTSAAEFTIAGKTCSTSLAAGASCTLSLAFKPTAAGAASATFKASDNASNSPQSVSLTGTGH